MLELSFEGSTKFLRQKLTELRELPFYSVLPYKLHIFADVSIKYADISIIMQLFGQIYKFYIIPEVNTKGYAHCTIFAENNRGG